MTGEGGRTGGGGQQAPAGEWGGGEFVSRASVVLPVVVLPGICAPEKVSEPWAFQSALRARSSVAGLLRPVTHHGALFLAWMCSKAHPGLGTGERLSPRCFVQTCAAHPLPG